MNKEEKETVEELRKQLRLAINIDDVATTIRNDDAETILNLIEKLQKENKKYKQFFDLMLRLDSDYFMNCGDEGTIKLVDEILKLESE